MNDETLIINGSIIVDDTGILILDNTTIYMKLNSDRDYYIDVYGELIVKNSVITAYDPDKNYYIRVFSNATLRIENSEISYAGYEWGE